jgi:hypothetical protein
MTPRVTPAMDDLRAPRLVGPRLLLHRAETIVRPPPIETSVGRPTQAREGVRRGRLLCHGRQQRERRGGFVGNEPRRGRSNTVGARGRLGQRGRVGLAPSASTGRVLTARSCSGTGPRSCRAEGAIVEAGRWWRVSWPGAERRAAPGGGVRACVQQRGLREAVHAGWRQTDAKRSGCLRAEIEPGASCARKQT